LLSVGVTYLPIPIGGACLLLFIIERALIARRTTLPHTMPNRSPSTEVN